MKLLRVLIFATCIYCASSEFFSAIDGMVELVKNDEILIKELKMLTENLEKKLIKLREKVNDIENEHKLMSKDPQAYVENPLNAFLLIKRLSYDIRQTPERILRAAKKFIKNVKEAKLSLSELDGTVVGINRLQEVYDLKTSDIAKGVIQDKKYRTELSAEDLLVLAERVMNKNSSIADEYLKLAREKNQETRDFSEVDILNEFFQIYNNSAQYHKAKYVLDELVTLDPNFKNESIIMSRVHETNLSQPQKKPSKEQIAYARGCSGKITKSAKESSELHCRYLSRTPFTIIAPLKIEEANLNPFVGIFHEILSDNEINVLRSIAQSKLTRALVMSKNRTQTPSSIRIAQLHWAYDDDHPVFKTLANRIIDMNGLSLETAEPWQIQNYGIGGHYVLHHDFAGANQYISRQGNRIATNLFYLSDVEKGGATIFPLLKIYVPPRKGTSVFWYNLSTSGDREYKTLHAACPVIVGSKMVMNKWLREGHQELYRPCELAPKPTSEQDYMHLYK